VKPLLLAHPRGQIVDLHVVVLDADGDGALGPVAAANVYAGGIPDPPGASLELQDHSSCEVLENGSFMRRPMKDPDQNSFKRGEVQGATSNSRSPRFVKSPG
jgi:hypothetical protein